MEYYYLIAQLPFLVYEQKPPMSSVAFKALAKDLLNEKDAVLLEELVKSIDPAALGRGDEAPATGCNFIDNWRDWDRTLRLNLAKHRAVLLKRENANTSAAVEAPYVPQDAASAAAKAVAGELSPLEGEMLLDKARWNAVDTMAGVECFERNQVYAYFIKLLLLERREAFNAEKGFSEYKTLYNQIIENERNSLGDQL